MKTADSAHLFEIEVCQIHLAFGENVHGEHIFSAGKLHLCDLRGDVPVVPLPPCDWISGVEGGFYL
jgi:hypothetical protein